MSSQNENEKDNAAPMSSHALEAGVAATLDGIAHYAEGAIHTLADNMAELLGGGPTSPSAPPPLTGEEERHQGALNEIREAQQAEAPAQSAERASEDKDAAPSKGRS